MSDMTPQEARELLHDWQEGGMVDWDDSRRALETIAADQIEYGVEYTGVNHGHRHTGSNASWHAKREYAEMEYRQMAESGMNPQLVARRVSTPWEVEE